MAQWKSMSKEEKMQEVRDMIRGLFRVIVFCVIAYIFWQTLPFLSVAFNVQDMFTMEKWNEIVYLFVLCSIVAIPVGAVAFIVIILAIFGKLAKGVSGLTSKEKLRLKWERWSKTQSQKSKLDWLFHDHIDDVDKMKG